MQPGATPARWILRDRFAQLEATREPGETALESRGARAIVARPELFESMHIEVAARLLFAAEPRTISFGLGRDLSRGDFDGARSGGGVQEKGGFTLLFYK